MHEHAIAAIPGDGIGPEVIAGGLQILEVPPAKGWRLSSAHRKISPGPRTTTENME
jgi:isocitrate/isopropylmalate dehydrogenase